jgi:hypothetical protein
MLSVLKEGKRGRFYLPCLSNKIPLAFCILKVVMVKLCKEKLHLLQVPSVGFDKW